MSKKKRTALVLLIASISFFTVGTVKFVEQQSFFMALVWATITLMAAAVLFDDVKRNDEKASELERKLAENAGIVTRLERLPAGTYEALGRIADEDDSQYGYIVQNVKTSRHHCVSHDNNLGDVFIIDTDGKVYESSRQDGRVLLEGLVKVN